MNLTLNTYTQWYWKIDLHNLLHFLVLRADLTRNTRSVPMPRRCWRRCRPGYRSPARLSWITGWARSSFSAPMLAVVRRMLAGEHVGQAESGLSRREWVEMMTALELPEVTPP